MQLVANGFISTNNIVLCDIDEVQEHGCTFYMAQKTVAKTVSFMRALDQARDVSDDKGIFACFAARARYSPERGHIRPDRPMGATPSGRLYW